MSAAPPSPSPVASVPVAEAEAEPSEAMPRVFTAEDDESLSVAQHMFAGGVAGTFEHMVMFPVDSVKTRLQSYAYASGTSGGMLRTTRAILAAEGPTALWRGIGAVAISAGPAHALYFSAFEASRSMLAPHHATDGKHHVAATALSGMFATVAADSAMVPWDTIKQRMQIRATYSSVLDCVRRVHAEHGAHAFFVGLRPTILMNIPFNAIYFVAFESAKKLILDWRQVDERQFSASSYCAAGAVAGAAAATASAPLDLVKTRLQTGGEVGARRYKGLSDALSRIFAEEGWRGMFRGVGPRVLFHIPAAAICWTTYEFCKHVMDKPLLPLSTD
jgi:solute carrier family 25 (mitochondrial iron transporter), member 28/37